MILKFIKSIQKQLFFAGGLLSLLAGFIGVFLPLWPTVPFILLAAFCFKNGSEKWHQWLLNQPKLGPVIQDWDENKVIRPWAKVLATTMILASVTYVGLFSEASYWLKGAMFVVCALVLIYIWAQKSRPSPGP